jgi:GWxTD domain-containing protein
MRSHVPAIFVDNLILPGDDGKTTAAFIFRFNNDFIPYKRVPQNNKVDAPESAEFFSTIRLNAEIFEGELKRREQPSANSASRDFWADTLYTSNFEETQDPDLYTSGSLSTQLEPGKYNYILQLSMMQEVSERNTQRRNLNVPDLAKKETGEVILIRKIEENANGESVLELMNMQNNIPFGEDFYSLIRIPNFDNSSDYSVSIANTTTSNRDTTAREQVYTSMVDKSDINENSTVALNERGLPKLTLSSGDHSYALISIPASSFENSLYELNVIDNGSNDIIAEYYFRSFWADMPASLYNLDISIRHLKYIISKEEIARINKGDDRDRERKFREFWAQRDPTPNTVYNELMAEYYRRIDYAFNEFGTQENPLGHESDQGEVYIKFGPPDNTERTFPESGRTMEIWEYPNRSFVFESTTGFGDFVLVGTR